MPTQSSLPSALKRSASSFARQITMMARSLAPAHLRSNIHTETIEEGDGVIRITTTVKAPDARAQEYGSGLHAQKGAQEKYPIRPKNKKLLAFYENARGTWIYPPAGSAPTAFDNRTEPPRGLFNQVMHPGIKAVNSGKGYIRPTYAEFRKKLKGNSELNNAVRRAIISDIRRSFRGNNG